MVNDNKEKLLLALSKRIKELRRDKRVTQEDALNDTGIQFSRIEQAKRDVQLSTLYKVCQYFEITLEEFFNENFKF